MATYIRSLEGKSEEELLRIGYETGKYMLELNKPKARMEDKGRKIIRKIFHLLKLDYNGLSDAQKCQVLYELFRKKQFLEKSVPKNDYESIDA